MYNVEIKNIEEKKVTALVLHTTFAMNRQAQDIPPFFHKVMEDGTLENVPNRINNNQICAFEMEKNSPGFDYYMGVEVSSVEKIPDGMKTITIPASKFVTASFIKRGNPDALQAFKFLTEKWMPENGCRQNQNIPLFIYYDERFIPVYKEKGYNGNPVAEIFIPIQ